MSVTARAMIHHRRTRSQRAGASTRDTQPLPEKKPGPAGRKAGLAESCAGTPKRRLEAVSLGCRDLIGPGGKQTASPFWPGWPAGPCGPIGPRTPSIAGRPGGPISPILPGGPGGPLRPIGPSSPRSPSRPSLPAGPGGPGGPCKGRRGQRCPASVSLDKLGARTCGPTSPSGPVSPSSPFGPWGHAAGFGSVRCVCVGGPKL